MVKLGLILALACAALSNVAVLCKHRGAVSAPEVRFGRPLRSAAELFASRWWAIGFAIAFVAWLLHIVALALAPISLVQSVLAGGLVLLALPAKRWFGITLGVRESVGLALSAVGLAFLAATASYEPGPANFSGGTMAAFQGSAIACGLVLLLSGSRGSAGRHRGLLLGAAAGILLGVSNVAIKALTETVPGNFVAIVSPWTAVALLAGIFAFFALARSLQVGRPIDVIVVSSVAGNVAAIVAGVLVFGDPMGSGTLGVLARTAAFAAVVGAAALVPIRPPRKPIPGTA